MKKYDFHLIGAVLALSVLLGGFQFFRQADKDAWIIVTQNGEIAGRYLLAEDNELVFKNNLGGRNVLRIKEGQAFMSEADCPDKLCIHQKSISKNGESIICLPHKLVIEVMGSEDAAIDAVTG